MYFLFEQYFYREFFSKYLFLGSCHLLLRNLCNFFSYFFYKKIFHRIIVDLSIYDFII